jgi:hypothetical protein
MCPMEAISFPTREEMVALMRELAKKYHEQG